MSTAIHLSRCSLHVLVALALWAVACGDPPAPQPVSHSVIAPSRSPELVHADDAFAALQRPDYRRPFKGQPDLVLRASELYLEACRAGDRRSCWVSKELRYSKPAIALMSDNCRAGHLMSCRALPPTVDDATLPGHAGRRCNTGECREIFKEECQKGFPRSCFELESEEGADVTALRARETELATEGCRAGVLDECRFLDIIARDEKLSRLVWTQLCQLSVGSCNNRRFDRQIEARDLLETACQHGRHLEIRCALLLSRYVEGTFSEPAPGRAGAIATFLCGAGTEPAACLEALRRKEVEKRPAPTP